MRRTRVRVQVVFEECDVETTGGDAIGVASPAGEGCFEVDFDPSLDLDIDTNEAALTRACAPALRDGLRTRLACVAKGRAIKAAGAGALVVSSCTPYPVDSEVGRFRIPTYKIQGARGTVRTRDMFPSIHGKEHHLTKGFCEIALLDGVVDRSFRKTSASINRVRHQANGGTPASTTVLKFSGKIPQYWHPVSIYMIDLSVSETAPRSSAQWRWATIVKCEHSDAA